jgi:transposase
MQVDYAGVKMKIVDPKTGEIEEAPVFVAVLSASNYTYAEVQQNENQCSWNNGHVRAFDYFGGVVRIVKPDNLKTGVQKPNYYEPDINLAYQELAEHYHFAVLPARVKKPRDKGKAENAVLNVERWVIAPLRKRTFFSLHEANQALRERLEAFNRREMQHVGRSRYQEYLEIDRPNLRPLPERRYEYAIWKKARVHIDYHVVFEKHFYSVPYALLHEEVEIRATERMIVIFHKGKQVAVHSRQYRQGRFTTQIEHMPANHRFVDQINTEQLIHRAEEIGSQTGALVSAILRSRPFPEQAFRSCLGVLSLVKKYPYNLVEQACQSLLASHALSYKALKAELEWLADQQPELPSEALSTHENIRGKSYYQ